MHLLYEWIHQAWDTVSPENIAHGFKKCMSNALDGSEDDILWEGLVEHECDDSESEQSEVEDLCEE